MASKSSADIDFWEFLDAPMSEWFRSIPSALDMIAYAAKFQQEVMARQIQFYRSRHQQIRIVMEKLRSENSELKRTNESLGQENEQLKQQLGYQELNSNPEETHESSTLINQNGKRSMDMFRLQYDHPSRRPRTDSSPHRTTTTPTRLTLPAGQHAPGLAHPGNDSRHMAPPRPIPQSHHGNMQTNSRPTSRQIGKFAYVPPETPHAPTPSLSQAQLAPKLAKIRQSGTHGDVARVNAQTQMVQQRTIHQATSGQPAIRSGNMGPPPLPPARLGTPALPSAAARHPTPSSHRFVPARAAVFPHQPSTSHGPQRFFPKTSGNSHGGTSGPWQSSSNSSGAYG
ncbi:hypothetical protein P691DRAFT_786221 [Macrolepiota fuliginosa MF-IS2]|uniref:Uncharacterized protein n=1 Tax=Macrolepiota fuliginosa MF-IS2 TaxID=1400762 RepID=A0A9P5XSM4_9AGAR|nr:hypothetical protein P691DRAFT_786221 [Macrolepiota fuliginosa MF-IS2]